MKKLLLLASFSMVLLSCIGDDKDDDINPIDEISILPIKFSGSSVVGTIKYDGNKIVEHNTTDNILAYEYSGNLITKLTKYKLDGITKMSTTDFIYNNDKLTNVSNVDSNNHKITYTYSYPNSTTVNCVEFQSYTSGGVLNEWKNVTNYNLNGGNILSQDMTTYHNNVIYANRLSIYTYDNKNNIYKNILGYDKAMLYFSDKINNFSGGVNNVLTENYTFNQIGTAIYKYKYTNTITYSPDNYPKGITRNQYDDASNQLIGYGTGFFEYNK